MWAAWHQECTFLKTEVILVVRSVKPSLRKCCLFKPKSHHRKWGWVQKLFKKERRPRFNVRKGLAGYIQENVTD